MLLPKFKQETSFSQMWWDFALIKTRFERRLARLTIIFHSEATEFDSNCFWRAITVIKHSHYQN